MVDDKSDVDAEAADADEALEELEIPDGVLEADQAVEMIRAWVADGNLHVIVNGGTFADVADWGRLLAACAQQIAIATELGGQMDSATARRRIEQAFVGDLKEADVASESSPTAGKPPRSSHH